jgi:hypothetical protein
MFSSGGALELYTKVFLASYELAVDWWQSTMVQNISSPGTKALTQGHTPMYTVIPRQEMWIAKQTLGVWVAPDGNYHKEGDFLLKNANNHASRLYTSNLYDMDTFIFCHSTYTPSMAYSSLTQKPSKNSTKGNTSYSVQAGFELKFPSWGCLWSKRLWRNGTYWSKCQTGSPSNTSFYRSHLCQRFHWGSDPYCSSMPTDGVRLLFSSFGKAQQTHTLLHAG